MVLAPERTLLVSKTGSTTLALAVSQLFVHHCRKSFRTPRSAGPEVAYRSGYSPKETGLTSVGGWPGLSQLSRPDGTHECGQLLDVECCAENRSHIESELAAPSGHALGELL